MRSPEVRVIMLTDKLRIRTLQTAARSVPQVVGTPEQVADEFERAWREIGCHGFNLSPTTSPDSIDDFVDHVVPILQRRGIFRAEYEGETFRANSMA